MMRRREIESRLALYDELSGILGAMKRFAMVELHRLGKQEEAEQLAMQQLQLALRDMASALPPAPVARRDIWLLLGSTRGFCGSFNEDVLHAWQAQTEAETITLAVGERLALTLPERPQIHRVSGAVGAQDAADTLTRLLAALEPLRRAHPDDSGLVVCLREEAGVRLHRLLPLIPPDATAAPLPLTNEPAAQVADKVGQHYLLHSLSALLLRSLYVENRMRLMQMESAMRHLERNTEEMQRERNRCRQEEIVEEIELVAGSRDRMAFGPPQ